MSSSLTYAVVTPVRNEASNIDRIAQSLAAQRVRPVRWLVDDTRSTDETPEVVEALGR